MMQKIELGFPLLRLPKELEGRAQNSPSLGDLTSLNRFGLRVHNRVMIFQMVYDICHI
jgi:hypothetical protein